MTDIPKRIRLSRKKGWRLPPGAVNVARPTKWGNPFFVEEFGQRLAVESYEPWFLHSEESAPLRAALHELRGKDLACWCNPGEPCHADVLLRLANEVKP